jgi:rhamnosyltransferase
MEFSEKSLPRVTVLMPTFNGGNWLLSQLESILNQSSVQVNLLVSDDMSNDDTWPLLEAIALNEPRVKLLSRGERFGSAGQHFFRLIRDADFSNCDFVAFADQDDVWHLDKLITHINLLHENAVDAVSSNVEAFWGKRTKLVRKNQPQQAYDYLFESAGPGCSFLMSVALVEKVRHFLNADPVTAKTIALHDWLTYAICRASGGRWFIDGVPSLQYRQHDQNVLGANNGFRSKWSRLQQLRNGWYRNQVIAIVKACCTISSNAFFNELLARLKRNKLRDRAWLVMHIGWFRRAWRDRVFLTICILFGFF